MTFIKGFIHAGLIRQLAIAHIALLAIGCLIEDRLPEKAFVVGDFDLWQCDIAVDKANKYLDKPIRLPDQCDGKRLAECIKKMSVEEEIKLNAFMEIYFGDNTPEVGTALKKAFTKDTLDAFWQRNLKNSYDLKKNLKTYAESGFDLSQLEFLLDLENQNVAAEYAKFSNKRKKEKIQYEKTEVKQTSEFKS
jgi:hypothetical protein